MKKTKNICRLILAFFLFSQIIFLPQNASAGLGEAVNYLKTLTPDAWITQALAAAGETSLQTGHLEQVSGTLATDYAKAILALSAVGENPKTFGNIDYVAKLKTYYNNNQMGDASLLNDDMWSIIALSSVGETNSSEITSAKQFILDNQNSNGGWGYAAGGESDSNDTAAAIIALLESGVSSSDDSIADAVAYLHSIQNSDGGFGWQAGSSSDSGSDAWVICALNKLGQNPASWAKENNTPKSHLESLQDTDGGYWWVEPGTSEYNNKVMTAYAVIALSGKSFPIGYYNEDENKAETYSLRIEGGSNEICDKNVSGATVKQVIENGASICGYTYIIEETSFGPYLKQINNEVAAGLAGWMYFVNNISPSLGIADYILSKGDEILIYYGEWGMSPVKLSVNKDYLNSGEDLIISTQYYDGSSWLPLAGARIKGGAEEYTANDSGQITVSLPDGTYSLFGEKENYIRSAKKIITVGNGVGDSVGLLVEIEQNPEDPDVAGESLIFEVTPNELSFGKISPGGSNSKQLTLNNSGTVPLSVSANVAGDAIFTENLKINQNAWVAYSLNLDGDESAQSEVSLNIPQNYLGSGIKTGELIFWATPK